MYFPTAMRDLIKPCEHLRMLFESMIAFCHRAGENRGKTRVQGRGSWAGAGVQVRVRDRVGTGDWNRVRHRVRLGSRSGLGLSLVPGVG